MAGLIERQAVIDVLKETGIIQDNDLGHLVVEEIERIPIAYDVEKVIDELDEVLCDEISQPVADEVVYIIRNGGVE